MANRQTGSSAQTGAASIRQDAANSGCTVWRPVWLGVGVLSLLAAGFMATRPLAISVPKGTGTSLPQTQTAWGQVPMRFEPNRGQAPAPVQYVARGEGYSLGLTAQAAWLKLRRVGMPTAAAPGQSPEPAESAVLELSLVNANPKATVGAEQPQASRSHYLIGNDPAKWQQDVPNYGAVRYSNVYPGIDWLLYGNPQHLEYDLVVAPNADPKQIRLKLKGAEQLALDADGNLAIRVNGATLMQHRPLSYQTVNGQKRIVDSRYVLDEGKQELAFALGDYDRSLPLTIDPVLVYSTFLGGSLSDGANGVAHDASGNAYVAGFTISEDFPTRNGIATPAGQLGRLKLFVSKFSPNGALLYSSIIGGSTQDAGTAIACDRRGAVYVTGHTNSTDFPVPRGAQRRQGGGEDAFVLKLAPSGSSIDYGSYLGGGADDYGTAIALTPSGRVVVAGTTRSANFPTYAASQPALRGGRDAFVAEFDTAGQLVYSTYLGGTADDEGNALAIDSSGAVFVAGGTEASDFPVVNAVQPTRRGQNRDGFITRFAADSSTRDWSTYLGGSSDDTVTGLAIDLAGNLVIAGRTQSVDFPVRSPVQEVLPGQVSGFLSRIDSAGTRLLSSTFLGANRETVAYAVAVDKSGAIYLAGTTDGPGFPQVNALDAYAASRNGIFVSKFSPDATALRYSTIIGIDSASNAYGISVDGNGAAVVVGATSDAKFPTVNAFQSTKSDPYYRTEAFVTRIGYRPTTLQFTAVQYEVGENGGTATVSVERSGASEGQASVAYAATAGSAVAGTDFTPASGTLRWADGETGSKRIRISILDNAQQNADKTVNLALGTTSEFAQLGSRSTAVLVIADDETPVRINTDNDSLSEGNSGTKLMRFHARLERRAYRTVKVHYFTASGDSEGSATPGEDYDGVDGVFSFAPGEIEKTFEVSVHGDTKVEPDETFTVNLDRCEGCMLASTQGVGTIVNDDVLASKPTFSISDASKAEGNSGSSTMTFTVTLSRAASADVSVDVSTADGTATLADGDYVAARRTLTFAAGQTSLGFKVTIRGDQKSERNESFTVNLSNAVGGKIVDGQGIGTIVNDD